MQKRKIITCTACSKGSDAEFPHPILKFPICGGCKNTLQNADKTIENNQEIYCLWCGMGDGCELFMCDTCVHSFCTDCLTRNFGIKESNKVRDLKFWTCYVCSPTTKSKQLVIEDIFEYYSIDKAYDSVKPLQCSQSLNVEFIDKLTYSEKIFAWLFSNEVINSSFQELNIVSDYLKANDILPVIYRISKNLRTLFKSKVFFIPGLFKTNYGIEYQCRLFPHQISSLEQMTKIENQSDEFDTLRGGILADEPGLGKTVTILALISSSSGTKLANPKQFWDAEKIAEHWNNSKGERRRSLHKVLNHLVKSNIGFSSIFNYDFEFVLKILIFRNIVFFI
jgi:hypothetical protein